MEAVEKSSNPHTTSDERRELYLSSAAPVWNIGLSCGPQH